LDSQDKQLLNLLQWDSRQSYARLGQQIGLSVTAVKDRIDKMQARGDIEKFTVVVPPSAAGYNVVAFVFVGIDQPEQCKIFENAIRQIPQIQECYHVTGGFNYLLKVLAADMSELENVVSTRIKSSKIASRTETTIVFSSPKVSGFVDCVKAPSAEKK
jgi:Lrp/AsnC family transcriptional regulator, leucine-responsive regulatory protein